MRVRHYVAMLAQAILSGSFLVMRELTTVSKLRYYLVHYFTLVETSCWLLSSGSQSDCPRDFVAFPFHRLPTGWITSALLWGAVGAILLTCDHRLILFAVCPAGCMFTHRLISSFLILSILVFPAVFTSQIFVLQPHCHLHITYLLPIIHFPRWGCFDESSKFNTTHTLIFIQP